MKQEVSANKGGGSLTINLFGPGMTALHKVGLAGLWMTLKALEKNDHAKTQLQKLGGSWDCTPTSVSLSWDGTPEPFFKVLFEESFKIDKNGLLWFPALGTPTDRPQHAAILNEALLTIHFQVPKTRGTKGQRASLTVGPEDAQEILHFLPFEWTSHQKASRLMGSTVIQVVGWLLPGATRRHEVHKETAFEEPWDRFLCLLYVPVGSVYFRVRQRRTRPKGKNKRPIGIPDFAMVLPEVRDLSQYATLRRTFLPYGTADLSVAGTSEAGWKLLATAFAAGLLEDIESSTCRVISYGASPGTRQKTRVELFDVRAVAESHLRTFDFCQKVLSPQLVRTQEQTIFWDVPQIPDLVAQNLSNGRAWWEGFADFVSDRERRDHVFRYEKGGMRKMVESIDAFPEGPERTFILACQEALRRHMGRKFARPGGADWGNEFEKVRVSIARCKNLASFRETITDLWSRGGSLHKGEDSLLQTSSSWWQEVLSLLTDKNWRKAKDLALLALASYPGSASEQEAK